MAKKKASRAAQFELVLPATSANLGPAFDAAALALNLYIHIRARVAEDFSITATGRDSEICQELENHLILSTYREVLERQQKKASPLALQIKNDIPIGKGCGSSAAARLAGIALAKYFGGLRVDGCSNHRRGFAARTPSRQRFRLLDRWPCRRSHVERRNPGRCRPAEGEVAIIASHPGPATRYRGSAACSPRAILPRGCSPQHSKFNAAAGRIHSGPKRSARGGAP